MQLRVEPPSAAIDMIERAGAKVVDLSEPLLPLSKKAANIVQYNVRSRGAGIPNVIWAPKSEATKQRDRRKDKYPNDFRPVSSDTPLLIQSGTLVSRIGGIYWGQGLSVVASAPHSHLQDRGTENIPARPFLHLPESFVGEVERSITDYVVDLFGERAA
jgi:hypothetical protein